MKREETVIAVNKWLVRNYLTDIEYLRSPSKYAKKIYETENIWRTSRRKWEVEKQASTIRKAESRCIC